MTASSKAPPERLALRAGPRPVTRINRRVLMVATGLGAIVLFGAGVLALDPPRARDREGPRELYNTRTKATPEGLAMLPKSYADLKPETPLLGPPLPGDLGRPVLAAEKDLGLQPDYHADPEDNAERAERIRQARLDAQARESKVFFQTSSAKKSGASVSPDPQDPFAALRTRADRLAGALGAFDRAAPGAAGFASGAEDPNAQRRKLAFLGEKVEDSIYNAHPLQDPVSPYQLMAGTIIPASLVTGLNSDLPGTVIAQVTENVYDTVTGNHLLVPQGTRLIGAYDSVVAYGQDRALVAWRRLVLPDGSSIVVDNLPGTDAAGYAGLSDRVDHHWGRILAGVGLATLLGVGTELSFGNNEDELAEAVRESIQGATSQAGQRIVDRNLGIQPTIRVRPGWPVRVIVAKDLVLRPYGEMP